MGVVTLSGAKAFLQITGAELDASIEQYILMVTADIEAEIDLPIDVVTITGEVLKYERSEFDQQPRPDFDVMDPDLLIFTEKRPVISATVLAGGVALVEDLDYILHADEGILEMIGGPSDFQNNLKINYTAGYATVPQDLQNVGLEGVKEYYTKGGVAKQGTADITSKRLLNYSISKNKGSDSSEQSKLYLVRNRSILDRYTAVSI